MLLTNQAIARLKIPAGRADHIEWDTKLSGWGVRINSGGHLLLILFLVAARTR